MSRRRAFAAGMVLLFVVFAAPATAQAADVALKRLDLVPGPEPANNGPQGFTAFDDHIYFNAPAPVTGGGTERELWRTDGQTAENLNLNPAGPSNPGGFAVIGDRMFFTGYDAAFGGEPRWTDGETFGLVQDLNPGGAGSFMDSCNCFGYTDAGDGAVIFSGYDDLPPESAWVTRPPYTSATKITSPATGPSSFTRVGDTVFFTAATNDGGYELYKTEQPFTSASLVRDIYPGPASSQANQMTAWNGRLYFAANDGSTGMELWTSDGTTTEQVKDFLPGGENSWGYPIDLTVHDGALYFTASTSEGRDVWRLDGTETEPELAIRVNATGSSEANLLSSHLGRLFFIANDGTTGTELYSSADGSAATRVADLNPGPGTTAFAAYSRAPLGESLLFAADPTATGTGFELWKSEPPFTSAEQVEIRPGPEGSNPFDLTPFGERVVFHANDGDTGIELYIASEAGAQDPTPPAGPAQPSPASPIGVSTAPKKKPGCKVKKKGKKKKAAGAAKGKGCKKPKKRK